MSTQQPAISIDDPRFDQPLPEKFPTRRFARALGKEGFDRAQWKADICGHARGEWCVNGDIQLVRWNCNRRFCPDCAERRVVQYFNKWRKYFDYWTKERQAGRVCEHCGLHHAKEFALVEVRMHVHPDNLVDVCRDMRETVRFSIHEKTRHHAYECWPHVLNYDESSQILHFRVLALIRPGTYLPSQWWKSIYPDDALVTAYVFSTYYTAQFRNPCTSPNMNPWGS